MGGVKTACVSRWFRAGQRREICPPESRQAVGRVLASGSTPVTELRAAVIIGSGSASFEMLRSLVEVLPFMVVPKWVTRTKCQPISIENVLENLLYVLGQEEAYNQVFEIGGAEVVTYGK